MAGPWFVRSAAAGTADGLSWTNAKTTLAAAATASSAGDQIWVADDHAETQASAMTVTFPGTVANPNICVCADHTVGSPGTGDWKTTGTVTTTSTNSITFAGSAYVYGLSFVCASGSGSGSQAIMLGNAAGNWLRFDACLIRQASGTASSTITMANNVGVTRSVQIEFVNTAIQFGNAGQSISANGARFSWKNTLSAIAGATLPTTLFGTMGAGDVAVFEGVDLSALGSGKTLVATGSSNVAEFYFYNCKLGSSVTVAATPATPNGTRVFVVNCDSSGTNYRQEQYLYEGTQTVETTIVRTSGASDGTTSISWKLVTTANVVFVKPFISLLIDQWNTTTGNTVNAYIRGIWNSASLPNNDQVWIETQYLGSAASPIASFVNSTKANNSASGAALTADTSAWDSLVTARQNSHAYVVGNTMTVGSGQVWFCTTSGTSSGSLPVGYSGAADGSSVTDGGAVFRAGQRFQMSVAMSTPQLMGSVYINVKMAAASSTLWIDPLIQSS